VVMGTSVVAHLGTARRKIGAGCWKSDASPRHFTCIDSI
jgi:hypothetical protein